MSNTVVRATADKIAAVLGSQIVPLFKDGAKFTLIIRGVPGEDETDFHVGDDDIDEAIKALERTKGRPDLRRETHV